MKPMTYDEWALENEKAIIPKLTPEFLEMLVKAGIACGWSVDMIEVVSFVNWCHTLANQPLPPKEIWIIPAFDDDVKSNK